VYLVLWFTNKLKLPQRSLFSLLSFAPSIGRQVGCCGLQSATDQTKQLRLILETTAAFIFISKWSSWSFELIILILTHREDSTALCALLLRPIKWGKLLTQRNINRDSNLLFDVVYSRKQYIQFLVLIQANRKNCIFYLLILTFY